VEKNRLAIQGGEPVIKEKLPTWPWFDEDTIQAVVEVLRSGGVNYWTGKKGMEFEKKFAEWCGAEYAVSTSSGTSALHTALGALNIGPGDEVITVPYTFIASSFCIVQAGAIPVFADVRREDHCLDPDDIENKITERTRAIIPVHLYGIVCDMDRIMEIAKKHNLYVIEDAAEAHGAEYKGKKAGTIGDVGCFSFCQNKTFTTGGEGGMIVTDNEEVAWEARSFRDHGYDVRKRMSLLEMEQALPYIHRRVGFNYRITEMQSVIGIKELEKIDTWNLPRRRKNAQILTEMLKDCPQVLTLPLDTPQRRNGYYVYPIVLNLEELTCDKNSFLDAVIAEGVYAWREFWPQSYKEEAYINHNGFGRFKFPFRSKEYSNPESVQYDKVFCPNCAWLEDRTFVVHIWPTLEDEHMHLVGEAILKVARAYAK